MSFPISPSNGQRATVNGIIYVFNSTKNAWVRQSYAATGNLVGDSATITGNITAGNIFISGNIYQNGSLFTGSAATTGTAYGLGAAGTWTAETLSEQNMYWYAVAYGNGTYIATNGNFNRLAYSQDGAHTWSFTNAPWDENIRNNGTPAAIRPLVYGNGVWLLTFVQGAYRNTATSPDGITWTSHTGVLPLVTNLDEQGHEWMGSIFTDKFVMYSSGVAGYQNSGYPRIISSTDGVNWDSHSPTLFSNSVPHTTSLGSGASGPYYMMDLAYGSGTYISVGCGYNTVGGETATTSAFWSTDLDTWTKTILPVSGVWQRIAYGNGIFIAISPGQSSAVRSKDRGQTWQTITLPGNTYVNIAYAAGQWIILQGNNSENPGWTPTSYSINDGDTWIPVEMPSFTGYYGPYTGGYKDITYGDKFVVVTQDATSMGTNLIAISETIRDCCYSNLEVASYLTSGNISIAGVKSDNYYFANGAPISFSGGSTAPTQYTVFANTVSSNNLIDSFNSSTIRSGKYLMQVTTSSGYKISDLYILQTDTASSVNEVTGITVGNTATFYTDVVSGVVNLYANPADTNCIVVYSKTMMHNTGSSHAIPEDLMTGTGTIDLNTDTIGGGLIDLNA